MSEELHTRVHPADVPPTVIHHPEDDETVLARWLRLAMEKGPVFWLPLGGLLILVIGLAVFAGSLASGESADAQVWADMILSKGAEEQEKVAEEHPDSPAAGWALLHAAQARYGEGLQNLPNNREAALPLLRQSIDLFQKAGKESPKDSPIKRIASMGIARALESRNELGDAIKEYEGIASAYNGTDEAKLAAERAKALQDPAYIAFYKDFYEFKPSSIALPPSGTGSITLPGDHPPLNGPTIPASGLPPVFPPEMQTNPAPKVTKPGGGEFPSSIFENNPPAVPTPAAPEMKPEAPKVEARPEPKPEAPKADPAPAPKPAEPPAPEPKKAELPGSPFPKADSTPAPAPAPETPAPEPKKAELPSNPFPTPTP